MSYQPLVSVVIPCYNSAEYIGSAIESVIDQYYKNIEIIVVDDCSTDHSVAIINNFKKKYKCIKLIQLEANSGTPSIPRNEGVKLSLGKYIALLDADDVWRHGKLSEQIKILESTDYFMCSTSCKNFKSTYVTARPDGTDILEPITLWDQFSKYRTPTSSILIRSSILKENLFNTKIFYRGREDLLQSLILHSKYGASIKICNTYVEYRVHENQISSKKLVMMLKVFAVFFSVPLPWKKIYYKLFIPYFICSNMFLSFWLRVILKKI